jgi:gliding motility-associated-like protein
MVTSFILQIFYCFFLLQPYYMNKLLRVLSLIIFSSFSSELVSAQTNQTVVNGSSTTAINFPGPGCTYNWVNNAPNIGLPASGTGDIPSFTAVNTGSGPLTATITATPASNAFAYIASGGGNVSLLNTGTNTWAGNLAIEFGAGVAASRDGSRVYITNQNSSGVTVIDAATNTVITGFAVGKFPFGVAVSPDGTNLYVANQADNTISVINTASYALIANVAVGTNPYGVAVSPDGSKVYVTNLAGASVSVINTTTNIVTGTIAVGLYPEGITVSPDGTRLYVANNLSSSISVINTASNSVVTTILAGSHPVAVVVSPDGNTLYETNAGDNSLLVINTSTNTVVDNIAVGNTPEGLSITPDGKSVYVVNEISSDVWVINTATHTVTAKLPAGLNPVSLGNFISPGPGCNGVPATFTITVNPTSVTPTITASQAVGTITACIGSPSTGLNIQEFEVSATKLTGDVTATAPSGFEVSLAAGSGYSSTLTIPQSVGLINDVYVFVRSSASAPAGTISGNVVLTSAGAGAQVVAVKGLVNALPVVNPVTNQTFSAGTATTAINFTGTAGAYNWTNNTPGIGLAANGIGNIAAFNAVNTGNTPITATITVTPVPSGLVFVANSNDRTVSVISTLTNELVATIPVGTKPEGVSVSPDGSRVYVTNRGSNDISVINTTSNTVIKTIPVGTNPLGVVVSPDGSMVYVANQGSNTVTVINSLTNTIISIIPVGSQPAGICISPDGKMVYVANFDDGSVSVISTATNTVVATIPIGGNPFEVAVNPNGAELYVSNETSYVYKVSTATNTILASALLNLSGNGRTRGLAVSADGQYLYVANAFYLQQVYLPLFGAAAMTATPGGLDIGVSMSPDGTHLYVTNGGLALINPIDPYIDLYPPSGSGASSLGNFTSAGTGCHGLPITFTITINPVPVITATNATGTISACEGSASSNPNLQQFTVSGNNLTGNITAVAPTDFEVSLSSGSGYGNTINIPPSAGSVNSIIVFLRSSASAPAGNISGNIILTSPGATLQNVAVKGIVNALPTVNPVTNQTLIAGNNTAAINFTGNADIFSWINDNIGIGLPASGTGNISSFKAVITGSGAVTANITVTPISTGFVCSGTPVTFTVTVNPEPTITVSGTLPPLTTTYGISSLPVSFTASGANMPGSISVTAPPGFEVSTDNISFSTTVNIGAAGTISPTTVYVRLTSTTPAGYYSGNITLSSQGTPSVNLSIPNSTVKPAPLTITANNVDKTYGKTLNSGSGSAGFTVSGLKNNETVGSITLTYGTGSLGTDGVGTYLGSVVPSAGTGGSFLNSNYSITYQSANINIDKATLTITADNKAKAYGAPNPDLTATYTGFVNNESRSQLTTLPELSTMATATSLAGNYPIIVTGGTSPNYNIVPVNGVLTITSTINIPNAFTPNGDGINDLWDIQALSAYPQCVVSIFTRYGNLIFQSRGYPKPWDGTYKGTALPMGAYYYVINLQNDSKPLAGSVTIIR